LTYILDGYRLKIEISGRKGKKSLNPDHPGEEGAMSATIFVRERRKVEQGEKKPRFRVVGVSGGDVKIYVKHMRKKELDQLSEATGAKVVFLKAGKEEKSGA
jgi:uncharacterized short protein YbdD (DUF466 family)